MAGVGEGREGGRGKAGEEQTYHTGGWDRKMIHGERGCKGTKW